MSELEKRVLDEIARRGLAPRPYAYFLAKRSVFLTLAAVALVLGAVSTAVLIFAASDYLTTGGTGVDDMPLDDVLLALPPVWLVTLGFFIASAYYFVRQTPRGYRYQPLSLLGAVVVLSLAFGALLHAAGAGQRVHQMLTSRSPLYDRLTRPLDKTLADPDKGWLAGTATGFDGKSTLTVRDFSGINWTVDVQGARITLDEPLGSDEDVSIKGVRTGPSTFRATSIEDWD